MTAFEDLALVYDKAIDWEQRLRRELPFLLKLVAGKENARILDLACGSGRHAVALAKQGFKVVGLDTSASMIKTARQLAQTEKASIDFFVDDMTTAEESLVGKFDLITCLGNSLALLPDLEALEKTIIGSYSLLRDSGVLVTQTLNFKEIRKSRFRFFPLKGGYTRNGSEVVFTRFFESFENKDKAILVLASFLKQADKWVSHISRQQVLQLEKPILENVFRKAGFSEINFYSGYDHQSFLPEASRSLVLVANR